MVDTTNHSYNRPAKGTDDYHIPLNANFAALDTDVEVRDTAANRTNYDAAAGALFRATDTGDVYLGDGSSWNKLNPPGAGSGTSVDTVVGSGDSLQSAVDAASAGDTLVIAGDWTEANDTFPILVDKILTIRGSKRGPGTTNATIHNASGNDTIKLSPSNQYNPGIALVDINIVQDGGGTGIHAEESKFGFFENVHVDGNGSQTSTTPLWLFDDPDDSLVPNSQVLVNCSAEQGGGDGFEFGNKAHHVHMSGCTALGNGRMGVYVNGPYAFRAVDCQLEDNAEPGLRARQADSVAVVRPYLEANATTANLGDCEVAFVDTDNAVLEGPAWCNGKAGGTAAVVRFDGVAQGAVREMQTDGDYTAVANIIDSTDIDVHSASHTRGSGVSVATVAASAARVRDDGVIVGAGTNNGGNNGLNGVDLTQSTGVSGQHQNDRAVSDGTAVADAFVEARWDAGSTSWVSPSGASESVTASGDGSTKTFTLSHSLGAAPPAVVVEATTEAASTDFWTSGGTASAVEITYAAPPPSGADNLGYDLSTGAGGGLTTVTGSDLSATNSPSDNQLPSFDSASGDFTWVDQSSGGSVGDHIDVQSVSNEVYAKAFSGATLDAKVASALSYLDTNHSGQGRVRVTPKDDGSAWVWNAVTWNPKDYSGIELIIDQNVDIEYSGSGWALTIDYEGSTTFRDSAFSITGGRWHATGTDPSGWCRLIDGGNALIRPHMVLGWENTSDSAWVLELRNDGAYCENTYVEITGKFQANNGMNFVPASVSGGAGTNSFHDTRIDRFQGSITAVGGEGVHMAGKLQYAWFGPGVALFAKANDVTGFVLTGEGDGWYTGTNIVGCKFETVGSETGTFGVETASGYDGFRPPMLFNPKLNGGGAGWITRNDPGGNEMVAYIRGDGAALEFGNLGVHTWRFGQTGATYGPFLSSPPNLPAGLDDPGAWYIDDGTNTSSGNVAIRIWDGSAWVDQN